MLSAPQGHRSADLSKEEGVTRGHLGPVAGTNLGWFHVASLRLKRTEQENGNPAREVQCPHLSEVRTEM